MMLKLKILGVGLCAVSIIFSAQVCKVFAEGTKQLVSSGGNRAYLEYRSDLLAGVARRTDLFVYVKNGEVINLASSANGLANGRINYVNPKGVSGQCATSTGVISSYAQEQAGPLPNAGGYTPCQINVTTDTEGIWQVAFTSPNQNSTANPPQIAANASWSQPNNVSYVSAWDITVRDSNGIEKKGRAYANYISWNMGTLTASLASRVYVKTNDAYVYRIDLHGIQPFGFIFFSNNKGITNLNEIPTKQSFQLTNGSLPSGYKFLKPSDSDTVTQYTNKIFFELPSSDLPANALLNNQQVWLAGTPPVFPQASSFSFEGVDGTPSKGGTFGKGGNFVFNADIAGNYRIILDLNKDSIYGNANDRILEGDNTNGVNQIFWNGLDGNGTAVPAGQTNFDINLSFTAGEIHFPFIDVESNPNGIIIERINPTPSDYRLFYDDSSLTTVGTPPSPIKSLTGVNSQNGTRSFSNDFGNDRIIDTWALQVTPNSSVSDYLYLSEADIAVSTSHSPQNVSPGSQIVYTVDVQNLISSHDDVSGIKVTDSFPSGLSNITWSCSIIDNLSGTSTNACGSSGGAGNINTTVNLNKGSKARFVINAQVASNFTGNLINTASIDGGVDSNDSNSNNNSSTDTTNVIPQANLSISKELVGNSLVSGTSSNYKINIQNNGPQNSQPGFVIRDTLPAGLSYNSLNTVLSDQGWTCTQNNSIIDCTFNNLLNLNQSTNLYIKVNVL